MEIYWDNLPPDCETFLTELVERGLVYAEAPKKAEISISFVSRDEIQQLNLQYREIDTSTDVLSFPFYEPGEWDDTKPIALGDIIICLEIAEEQARTYGHSLKRELGFLTVHGLLHLLGYDHIDSEDEKVMRQAQRDILGDLQ